MYNKQIERILDYLTKRDDYVIFAGFASFLHTGIEASLDVDAFFSSKDKVKEVSDDFKDLGWKLTKEDQGERYMVKTMEENDTTFDICYSDTSSRIFLPKKISIAYEGRNLYTLSPECMLLSKLSQLTSLNRTEYKTGRDRNTIKLLREMIDAQKMRELVQEMPYHFWQTGHF